MANFGQVVVYLLMTCALIGAITVVINKESPLAKEFLEGIYSVGPIFIPVAGIMAAAPYINSFIIHYISPLYQGLGSNAAMASTSFIAVDMGGYQLAHQLAHSPESWITAMMVGYTSGATIVYSLPVGLAMLHKRDHQYMALGMMSGFICIPIAIFVSNLIIYLTHPDIRLAMDTTSVSNYPMHLHLITVIKSLSPILLLCFAIAFGLKMAPNLMIRLFLAFGKILYSVLVIILVLATIEHFTGIFSRLFGAWHFLPIIKASGNQLSALQLAGYIALMLSGAFPLMYLIKRFLGKPIDFVGKKIGMDENGAEGLLASMANILAMYHLVKDMSPKDKVLNIAFAVCAAFLFGDHLAFTANFQPSLIVAVLIGKLTGGILAFILAYKISVPKALLLEKQTAANIA